MIYLDNAATTYPKPEEVYKHHDLLFREHAFNAGRSSYKSANHSMEIIDKTREELCKLVNAVNCIFTTSITQAFNMLIQGLEITNETIIYISPYEHNAVIRTLIGLQSKINFTLLEIPIDNDYRIDLESLSNMVVIDKPDYIFCNHVSNVTGYILPIYEIGLIAKKSNSVFIVDGAQSVGVEQINVQDMNIDYLCFAGHKTLYGPFGVGGILCKKEPSFNNTFFGGTGTRSLDTNMPVVLPEKYEPSSPNVVAIGTLYSSIQWLKNNEVKQKEHSLLLYLLESLESLDEVHILSKRETNTSIVSIIINGFDSNDVSKLLYDQYDICTRSGYHCCPLIHKYFANGTSNGTIRISMGYFNTNDDIDALISALEDIIYG